MPTGPESPSVAALDVDGVRHAFGDRLALDGVSLRVEAGEMFGLLGPNGGGKTTLFRIAATLLRPSGGHVRVFGDDTASAPARVRRRLGVVFQSPALDPRLTVRENLQHHGHLYGIAGTELARRLDEGLARVRLADRANAIVRTLSGGLQRRAEIAKALLTRPALLLLDEPTMGLDPSVRAEVWRDLRRATAERGTTVVLTTHLMDEAAACDRVALLDRGRVVLSGRPDDLTGALGGDVITIDTADPEALAEAITARLRAPARVVDGQVRIERERAHEFVSTLVEAFPGDVRSIRFSRPTLQDVFVHHTGHRFD